MSATIRPFQSQDRAEVRRLFQETAFHGRSYQHFFDDGEWLADIMTASYTDGEPTGTFVAESDGRLVGYLTGTLDSDSHVVVWRNFVLKRAVAGFFKGGTWKSGRAWRFFWYGLISFVRGQLYQPKDLSVRFPAHFHVNVDEKRRQSGIGVQLVRAFFDYMREHGVVAAHVRSATTDAHHRFFEGRGFRVLLSRRLTLWRYTGQPVMRLVTYGINLKPLI